MKKLSLILVALLALTCLLPALSETTTEIPNPIAAQSKEEFIGEWELCGAAMLGIYMDAATLGASAQLTINESTAVLVFEGETGVSTWELLEDGTVEFTDPDQSTGIIVLNDNGTISLDTEVDMEGTTYVITLYFARVETPQA